MDEASFRNLISGQRRGVAAASARAGLQCLSFLYSGCAQVRNFLYDKRCLAVRNAAVPVVSIGNITTGGTGKTPLVAYLANYFRDQDVNVGIISRGYRSLSDQGNDEKLVLDQLCPGVPHEQNPDRVKGAEAMIEKHGCEILVLDDGFQHRRLARQLDIVLIDALNPWGYDYVLPRGLLREPVESLRRADMIVLTRADQCRRDERDHILSHIAKIGCDDRIAEVVFQPSNLINVDGQKSDVSSLKGCTVQAFCGVGNPESFRQTVAATGMQVKDVISFPDHHHYAESDLRELDSIVEKNGVQAVVTTQKDLVKLDRKQIGNRPLWALVIGTRFLEGQSQLHDLLQRTLSGSK